MICLSSAYPNLLSAPCSLSLGYDRRLGRKVMLNFLLELRKGYYIFSRATKILKLVALLATNDLP